ncbi:MAG: D-aminoacylase [SAR202 cluster bacterium]|nr:D-aminoacylase [SAR202 cluster bacterium]
MFDVLITNGTVVDGTGAESFRADIGITGRRIESIGNLSDSTAKHIIDATNLTISPGFIDTHVHCDGALLMDPQHASSLRQGVTTEILGQDGLSYAPLSAKNYHIQRRYLSGILGSPPENLDMTSVASFRSHYNEKVAVNTAYPVSHGALRIESVGFRDAPLTDKALEHAKGLLRQGLEQGAVGLATGMSYHPNAWSTTSELIELCKVVAEANGVYITHLRDVNTDRAIGGGGIPEALEIGRRSGVKVHFSHTRTSVANAGQVADVVALIDQGKAEGIDCTLELYPYPTGSSLLVSNLPSWAHDGGPDKIIERLKTPSTRSKIIESIEAHGSRPLTESVLSYMPNKNSDLEGMPVSEIAKCRGKSLGEVVCDLLIEEDLQIAFWMAPPNNIYGWQQVSRDALELLSRSDYMVGSDSIPLGSVPHPRAYGTFPRFLGRLRREFGTMGMEAMVQRLTDNAARRFGLTNRGRITTGYFADITVFDAERIIDTATYDNPRQYAAGIPYVLVNGKVAVDHERCTGVLAGQAIP